MGEADHRYCESLVRDRDRERWLAALYAPAGAARRGLLARHALDLELATVVAGTTEPMIGYIRLAWWREAVERLATNRAPAQPVLQALAETPPAPELVDPLVDACESMIEQTAGAEEARGRALFALLAGALTAAAEPQVLEAGSAWADGNVALQGLPGMPRVTRPVTALARLARLGGPPASPRRQLAILAHIVTGRL